MSKKSNVVTAANLSVGAIRVALVADGVYTGTEVNAMDEDTLRAAYLKHKNRGIKDHETTGTSKEGEPVGKEPPKDDKSSFAEFKAVKPPRDTVSSDRLRKALEELVADSNAMGRIIKDATLQQLDKMAEAFGLPGRLEAIRDELVKDLKDQAAAQQAKLDEWLEEIEKKVTTRTVFKVPDRPTIEFEDQHYMFGDLLFNCTLRKPSLLVGPSGSGKTSAMMQVAKLLKVPFSYIAIGPTQTESRFSGYQNAEGVYIPTEFYLRYKYGGVLGLDELDAGNPSVLVWLNGAVSNRIAGFPRGFMSQLEEEGFSKDAEELREAGGMVSMHPDCIIIASANTYGKGADMVYQGRNALDGATLKRFKVITWDYDTSLERKLAPFDKWTTYVQTVRDAVFEMQIHHIVSPVDSIDGGQMILAGKPWRTVAKETVFAALRENEIDRIVNHKTHKDAIAQAAKVLDIWESKRGEANG